MRKTLTIIGLSFAVLCQAQKQGNVWYFGSQSGLDFTSGAPVILSNGQTGTGHPMGWQEGTSCISDSSGSLLFYTGGEIIWNRNHAPMPNGTGLLGGVSSTQSSLIVPLPGSDSIFYVFTSDEYQNSGMNGYRYSVVNMCLDSGNGDVITGQKNILLCDSSTEKLSACEDANGTGYWIMGHKRRSNEFRAWHLTSGGITNTVISKIGTVHGWKIPSSTWYTGSEQGEMKFNSAGTKLALAISNFDPAYLDVFDFNNNTGVVSNFCHMVLDSALNKRIFAVEFSPDGSKLYTGASGGSGGRRLYQFNMAAAGGNCDSILASRFTLFQDANGPTNGMQLAPDGKIYAVINYWDLSSINNPNLLGSAANFTQVATSITGQNSAVLPNLIAGYKYHNGISCPSEVGIAEHSGVGEITVFPNPSTGCFTIQTNNVSKVTGIEIFNVMGEKIQELAGSSSGSIKVDISKQPEGVYFVRVKTLVGVVSKKLLVTR